MNSKLKSTLSEEEKKISSDLAKGRYRSLSLADQQKYAQLARRDIKRRKAVRKEERINIRLTSEQLTRLKKRAEQEGLPYQSLVASVIQKYLNGTLLDVTSLSSMRRVLKKAL
jgi:predicted DNA binding CopG/RHH family protein